MKTFNRLLMALGLLSVGVSFASALEDAVQYPVVVFPEPCTAPCAAFPELLSRTCVGCMLQVNGTLTTWIEVSPPINIRRLPYYEAGFVNLPAFVVTTPAMYRLNPSVFARQTSQFREIWQNTPATNVTVCSLTKFGAASDCVTRLPGSSMKLNEQGLIEPINNGAGCVLKQGWLRPYINFTIAPACEGSSNLTLTDITFDRPSHLAMLYPSLRNLSRAMPADQRWTTSAYTNVDAAADSIWQAAQNAHSPTLYFHNVSLGSDVVRLQELYGADWDASWEQLAAVGDLVELDLTYYEGLQHNISGKWNVAAHVLMRYVRKVDNTVVLRAAAVRLSNVPTNPTAFKVYTPQRSASAFILACVAARSAVTLHVIWIGHLYQLHLIQGAVDYALYNTIDVGVPVYDSTHPVRVLTDVYASSVAIYQFHCAVFARAVQPPRLSFTHLGVEALPALFEKYADRGVLPGRNTLYSLSPEQMLHRSGLDATRFTSAGGKEWDLYPLARFALDMNDIAENFVSTVVNAYYSSDAAVAADTQVQAWADMMVAPRGANLRRITASNTIKTRADLTFVMGQSIWMSLTHSMANLPDYLSNLYNMGRSPFALTIYDLFDPTATFTTAQIVAATTDAFTYSTMISFTGAHNVAVPTGPPWVKPQCIDGVCPPNFTETATPDYTGNLPFKGNNTAAVTVANNAVIRFRRAVPAFLAVNNNTRTLRTQLSRPNVMANMFLNWMMQ